MKDDPNLAAAALELGPIGFVLPTATLSTPNVGAFRLLKGRAFLAKKVGSVRANAERRDYQHKDGIASFAKFYLDMYRRSVLW
jgi:hypothetical protein